MTPTVPVPLDDLGALITLALLHALDTQEDAATDLVRDLVRRYAGQFAPETRAELADIIEGEAGDVHAWRAFAEELRAVEGDVP